jgi:hypothetical protein
VVALRLPKSRLALHRSWLASAFIPASRWAPFSVGGLQCCGTTAAFGTNEDLWTEYDRWQQPLFSGDGLVVLGGLLIANPLASRSDLPLALSLLFKGEPLDGQVEKAALL